MILQTLAASAPLIQTKIDCCIQSSSEKFSIFFSIPKGSQKENWKEKVHLVHDYVSSLIKDHLTQLHLRGDLGVIYFALASPSISDTCEWVHFKLAGTINVSPSTNPNKTALALARTCFHSLLEQEKWSTDNIYLQKFCLIMLNLSDKRLVETWNNDQLPEEKIREIKANINWYINNAYASIFATLESSTLFVSFTENFQKIQKAGECLVEAIDYNDPPFLYDFCLRFFRSNSYQMTFCLLNSEITLKGHWLFRFFYHLARKKLSSPSFQDDTFQEDFTKFLHTTVYQYVVKLPKTTMYDQIICQHKKEMKHEKMQAFLGDRYTQLMTP